MGGRVKALRESLQNQARVDQVLPGFQAWVKISSSTGSFLVIPRPVEGYPFRNTAVAVDTTLSHVLPFSTQREA